VDNSIKLKELQLVSGALRIADEGLGIFFPFPKGSFLGEEGRMRFFFKD
jgi:hypothetical protein